MQSLGNFDGQGQCGDYFYERRVSFCSKGHCALKRRAFTVLGGHCHNLIHVLAKGVPTAEQRRHLFHCSPCFVQLTAEREPG